MCQAFSGLITKSGKVYWKLGVDSHDEQQGMFVKEDPELKDDRLPPKNTFARFEIVPKNGDYFSPDKWVFWLDERIKPSWWNKSYEKPCFEAHRQWLKQLYSVVKLDEAKKPINPLIDIPERKKITKKDLEMLKEWSLVWESAGKTIRRDSVWHARGSVWNPIWESLWMLVGRLVWNSEWRPWKSINILGWAYVGSLLKTHDWKHIDWRKKPFNKIGKGNYPFRSGEYLWRHGLVPSFDGTTWRLHTGPKARVIWKGKIEEVGK